MIKKLTIAQRIQFLTLMTQMSGNSVFQRVLDLEPHEINHYKKLLDVETADEARVLLRKLEKQNAESQEARISTEVARVRAAEETANKRLQEFLNNKQEKPLPEIDVNAIKEEEAIRQRRYSEEVEKVKEPESIWRLPLEGSLIQREESIKRFRREIVNHGLSFCSKKYNANATQIKFEAERLGLKVKWDIVRR